LDESTVPTVKTAVVTGGSGGIGKACGKALRERGYDVLLVARRPEPLCAAAEAIGARWVAADCTKEADVEQIMQCADAPAVLVHAAGAVKGSDIRDHSLELFDELLDSNLRAAYLITRAVLAEMRSGGRLFFVSSTAGLKGVRGFSAYSASKAGLNAFANSIAAEVEGDGIGVHLITPAPVRTEILDTAPHNDLWLLEPEDVASAVAWIDSLSPRVVIREIVMRSAMAGPFAPKPLPAQQT
jgi:NAD(P)-dependent dehydrogenase (short-subunit alcohol dehydrogenase family)